MPTTKQRLNLSLSGATYDTLQALAEVDDVTPTSKAHELLKQAIEMAEDKALFSIAKERDKKSTRYLSHKSVWR